MKTKIPQSISNAEQARKFLCDLSVNKESYHTDDNAHSINWTLPAKQIPTSAECDQLNKVMEEINLLPEFDPCEFLISLDKDFSTKDKTGRGFFNKTTGIRLFKDWDLNNEDWDGQTILSFLTNSSEGDTWEDDATLITCTSDGN